MNPPEPRPCLLDLQTLRDAEYPELHAQLIEIADSLSSQLAAIPPASMAIIQYVNIIDMETNPDGLLGYFRITYIPADAQHPVLDEPSPTPP